MTIKEAEALGYKIIKASPFEAGLTKDGRGIRTWWSQEFDRNLPMLDHPVVMEAIRINEEMTKKGQIWTKKN